MRRNTKTMYEWRKAYRDKEELMLERGFPEISPHEFYRDLFPEGSLQSAEHDGKDIQTLNGFSIRDFVEMTKSEVNAKIRIIQKMIRELDFLEYADLLDYLQDNEELADEYDVAINHTILLNTYIKSRRYKREPKSRVGE